MVKNIKKIIVHPSTNEVEIIYTTKDNHPDVSHSLNLKISSKMKKMDEKALMKELQLRLNN